MTESLKYQPEALRGAFLEGMSRIASTVCIVATEGPAGHAGATVTSQVSVTADGDHPTLLICLHRDTTTAQSVKKNGIFSVNALADDQKDLADTFAGRTPLRDSAKFGHCDWVAGATGAPRLLSALVSFDCRVRDVVRVGSHSVIFGEVVDITVGREFKPLLYGNRRYASVDLIREFGERTAA